MSSNYPKGAEALDLAEVWGDIVRRQQLILAITIGATISLVAYWAATFLLSSKTENGDIARALAMLVGIVGCVISGVICALLIKPKREVVDYSEEDHWRMDVLDQLAGETGTIGHVLDLPPAVVAEMKEVGVYNLFENYKHRQENITSKNTAQNKERKGS